MLLDRSRLPAARVGVMPELRLRLRPVRSLGQLETAWGGLAHSSMSLQNLLRLTPHPSAAKLQMFEGVAHVMSYTLTELQVGQHCVD